MRLPQITITAVVFELISIILCAVLAGDGEESHGSVYASLIMTVLVGVCVVALSGLIGNKT